MPQKPRLDVVQNKRPLQKRIVLQINLPHRKIIRRPPVSMHPPNLFPTKRRHICCPPFGSMSVLSQNSFAKYALTMRSAASQLDELA
jgi:hypothetical protein